MKILVIDDDKEIRDSLKDILEDEGHIALLAENGEEGLEIATSSRPSLILLDLLMPVMDGKTFRDKQLLDSKIASIPTVVFTASGAGEITKIRDVEVYLKKPIDLGLLLEVIDKYK